MNRLAPVEREPIRIAIIGDTTVPSALSTPGVSDLLSGVRAQFHVLAPKAPGQGHQGRFEGARVFRVNAPRRSDVFRRAALRHMESTRFDVVHILGADHFAEYAQMAPLSVYEPRPSGLDTLWVERHVKACVTADMVLVPTAAAAENAGASGAKDVCIVRPGVRVDTFDDGELLVDRTSLRIASLSDFESLDFDVVFDAIERARNLPLHFLFAGEPSPDARDALRERVQQRELVHFISIESLSSEGDEGDLLRAASAGLFPFADHPAMREAGLIPHGLLPAVASGRPVLTPDFPGVREVSDSRTRLSYVCGSGASLSQALHRVPEVASEHLREAKTALRSQYSWQQRRYRLSKMYELLFPGSQKSDPWVDCFASLAVNDEPVTTARALDGFEPANQEGNSPSTIAAPPVTRGRLPPAPWALAQVSAKSSSAPPSSSEHPGLDSFDDSQTGTNPMASEELPPLEEENTEIVLD